MSPVPNLAETNKRPHEETPTIPVIVQSSWRGSEISLNIQWPTAQAEQLEKLLQSVPPESTLRIHGNMEFLITQVYGLDIGAVVVILDHDVTDSELEALYQHHGWTFHSVAGHRNYDEHGWDGVTEDGKSPVVPLDDDDEPDAILLIAPV